LIRSNLIRAQLRDTGVINLRPEEKKDPSQTTEALPSPFQGSSWDRRGSGWQFCREYSDNARWSPSCSRTVQQYNVAISGLVLHRLHQCVDKPKEPSACGDPPQRDVDGFNLGLICLLKGTPKEQS
jgi:hypothetical protein